MNSNTTSTVTRDAYLSCGKAPEPRSYTALQTILSLSYDQTEKEI